MIDDARITALRTELEVTRRDLAETRDALMSARYELSGARELLATTPADATVRERVLSMEVAQLKRNLHTMDDRLAAAEGRPVRSMS